MCDEVISMRVTSVKNKTCNSVNQVNPYKTGFLWDIGKQHSPRCDTAECGAPSGSILFAQRNFIDKKIKITPNTPKNESGLLQLIMMGESIRQIWV